ncbi:MAG TPA: hypothetical protein VMT85_12975, partial [Thermoanaerobaculia bacterium]|nr:hypothetical protein [Thermoanaerobaculia bacterium]
MEGRAAVLLRDDPGGRAGRDGQAQIVWRLPPADVVLLGEGGHRNHWTREGEKPMPQTKVDNGVNVEALL